MSSTHRNPVRIALLAAAVVAGGVLPAVSASADPAPPVVTYESFAPDDSLDRLFANDPTGSGTPAALSPTLRVDSYDVSEDGNTLVAAVTTQPFSTYWLDTSWGVVHVSRATGITHLIGTDYQSPIVLSADGRTAYWMSDGWMVSSTDGATGTRLPTPYFAPGEGERISTIAISPDGTFGAVLYQSTESRKIRVSPLTSSDGAVTRLYSSAGYQYPLAYSFLWLDNHRLLYSVGTTGSMQGSEIWDLQGPSDPTSLGAVYDVSRLGSTYYAWHDVDSVTSMGTTTDPLLEPTGWIARPDGTTTYGYDVTSATPPAIGTADNRTTGYLVFALTKSSVVYGQRAAYASRVEYNIPYAPVDYAYWNCRGTLEYTTDRAVTWHVLRTTSCASRTLWPDGSLYWSNGSTQLLTRTTWFRWTYPGDALTLPARSLMRVVSVTPILTVRIARSGSYRKVYGSATRVYGTAYLQKWSSTRRAYVNVTSARLTSRGAYSFGYRALSRGTYRVYVLKDSSWNAVAKRFTI